MEVRVGDVVLPGDYVVDIICETKTKTILGPGLRENGNKILTSKSGILCKKEPNTYYIDSHQKRYIPSRGETVVGIVAKAGGDVLKIDIGSSEQASLSCFAFEGATKKNRPDVNVGDIVFGKLVSAYKDLEPELVCVDSFGKSGKLGILSDGFLFTCSLNLVRKILNPKCPLLKTMAKEVPFEMAAGMNGKIWIKSRGVRETISIANAILAAEYLTNQQIINSCENIANVLSGFA